MDIGTFRAVDEGYVGHIVTLSFGRMPVVILPSGNKEFSFEVLFLNADDRTTIKFGSASRRAGTEGSYLKVTIDCPALAAPIQATMSLKPSREGVYTLTWVRHERRTKAKKL
jgi:uncharacterized protein (DUF736 family)